MDAIDPSYAPGLGTPEPFGMTPRDVRTVIGTWRLWQSDSTWWRYRRSTTAGDVTSVLGAKLIRDFIAAKWKSMQ